VVNLSYPQQHVLQNNESTKNLSSQIWGQHSWHVMSIIIIQEWGCSKGAHGWRRAALSKSIIQKVNGTTY